MPERVGTIEWLVAWRINHPTGRSWPPLIVSDFMWQAAKARAEAGWQQPKTVEAA